VPSIAMFVGSLLSLLTYAALFISVFKIFQLGNELNEVKELLRDVKRSLSPIAPPAGSGTPDLSAYRPPDLATLAAEMDREGAYEVPSDRITILNPPR
jgi:hypothetical protein